MTVNGQVRPLAGTPPHASALDWLRSLGLTGAKEGCAEGECGACAVLLATPAGDGGTSWTPVNACLLPALALDGQEVVTAEGLGSPDHLHPVQQQLAAAGGSQCGYCTPGFACSMAAEFYRTDRVPQQATAEQGPNGFDLHAIGGNLCRCTGYRPLRDAAYALGMPQPADPLRERLSAPAPAPVPTRAGAPGAEFVRPSSLDEALTLLRDEPSAVAVAGSTDWGVEANLRGARAPLIVVIDRLPELRRLVVDDDIVRIGAAVPLSELERDLGARVPLLGQLLPQFASRLIRNRATIGGNLGTASPIGDTAPALLALGAELVLQSADGGERVVDLAEYFTGYRTTVRRPDELIREVRLPLRDHSITAFHKVTKRRFDDISSVAVAFALDLDGGIVTRARIGLGGVAATPLRAYATEQALASRPWDHDTVRAAAAVLEGEGTPMSDHRAGADYRARMLGTALLALYAGAIPDPAEVPA
ncbi:xanthine dehydrogenase small subunit [Microbacterium atlanticum]|uniref:xanthine dehydrogenase small subunit n=1 Tax=Microbacterium atlanticum TaxID=2782168 RepID=UPI001887301D|nr:FAD binding domain-containing protein [Microbacterium atlanticum]